MKMPLKLTKIAPNLKKNQGDFWRGRGQPAPLASFLRTGLQIEGRFLECKWPCRLIKKYRNLTSIAHLYKMSSNFISVSATCFPQTGFGRINRSTYLFKLLNKVMESFTKQLVHCLTKLILLICQASIKWRIGRVYFRFQGRQPDLKYEGAKHFSFVRLMKLFNKLFLHLHFVPSKPNICLCPC